MKRLIRILSIFNLVLICSCSFLQNSNTVLLALPYRNNVSKSAEENNTEQPSEGNSVYTFEVSLTDSGSTVQTKTAKSGEQILFSDIPVGTATISITAYDDKNVACYSGGATFEVIEGENQINVPIKKIIVENNGDEEEESQSDPQTKPEVIMEPEFIYITINFPTSGSQFSTTRESFSAESLLNFIKQGLNITSATYKFPVVFNNGEKLDLSNEAEVSAFISSINADTVLTVKIGVNISDYDDFLCSAEVQGYDNIYFVQDDNSITEIPEVPDSKSSNAMNLIMDFSDCNQITSISTSAYSDVSSKWVSRLYLPKSITTIAGISCVVDEVYIPLTNQAITFSTDTVSEVSNYKLYFDGSVSDWCGRVTGLTSITDYPGSNVSEFYVKNGSEYVNIMDNNFDLIIESTYCMNGNDNDLTAIPDYIFYNLRCKSIRIKGDASSLTIGNYSFGNMDYLTDVYIERNVLVTCESDSFTTGNFIIHVPADLEDDYSTDAAWSSYTGAGVTFEQITG